MLYILVISTNYGYSTVLAGSVDHSWYGDHQLTHMGWRKPFAQYSRPFPPSYDEAVMSGDHTMVRLISSL